MLFICSVVTKLTITLDYIMDRFNMLYRIKFLSCLEVTKVTILLYKSFMDRLNVLLKAEVEDEEIEVEKEPEEEGKEKNRKGKRG